MKIEVTLTDRGPCAQPNGPEALGLLLAEYENRLRDLGIPTRELLRPGVSRGRVIDTMAEIGLTPPEELIVWFGWHNGAVYPSPIEEKGVPSMVISHYGQSLSVEVAVEKHKLRSTFPAEIGWNYDPGWLTLGPDSFGIAVKCNDAVGDVPLVRHVNDEHPLRDLESSHQVVSLCTLIAWQIDALEQGVYEWSASEQKWDYHYDRIPALVRATGMM